MRDFRLNWQLKYTLILMKLFFFRLILWNAQFFAITFANMQLFYRKSSNFALFVADFFFKCMIRYVNLLLLHLKSVKFASLCNSDLWILFLRMVLYWVIYFITMQIFNRDRQNPCFFKISSLILGFLPGLIFNIRIFFTACFWNTYHFKRCYTIPLSSFLSFFKANNPIYGFF